MSCAVKSDFCGFNAESGIISVAVSLCVSWRVCGSASRSWMTDSNLISGEQWNANVEVREMNHGDSLFLSWHTEEHDPLWELTAFKKNMFLIYLRVLVKTRVTQGCSVFPAVTHGNSVKKCGSAVMCSVDTMRSLCFSLSGFEEAETDRRSHSVSFLISPKQTVFNQFLCETTLWCADRQEVKKQSCVW